MESRAGGRRRRVTASATAFLALTAALGLAACGSAPSASDGVVSLATTAPSDAASAAPSESIDPELAAAAFTKCMKEHGVDVNISIAEGPGTGPTTNTGGPLGAPPLSGEAQPGGPANGAPDEQALQEADAACRHLLPSGMIGDPDATMDPAMADQLLAFSRCMRDHGIDYPDPQFNGNGVTMQLGEGLDPTSKTFQDAQQACGTALPGGGFTTGPVSGGANAGQQP